MGLEERILIFFCACMIVISTGLLTGFNLAFGEGEPVSNAGPDQVVDESTQVTLNGTGSSSPTNAPLVVYEWIQTDSNPILLINGNGTAITTFTAPTGNGAPSTLYTLRLVVTDANGLVSVAPDDVSITVNHKAAGSPIIAPSNPSLPTPELKQSPSEANPKIDLQSVQGNPAASSLPTLGEPNAATSGPKLIESIPAEGASDVPVTKPKIVAKFDKEIDISSIAVIIADDKGNQVEVKKAPQAKGSTLTILPNGFNEGTHYTVSLDGIKDNTGNQGSYKISFTTAGPLAEKTPVSEASAVPVGQDTSSSDQSNAKKEDPSAGTPDSKSTATSGQQDSSTSTTSGSKETGGQSNTSTTSTTSTTSPPNTGVQNPIDNPPSTGKSQLLLKITGAGPAIEMPLISFKAGISKGDFNQPMKIDPVTFTHKVDQNSVLFLNKMNNPGLGASGSNFVFNIQSGNSVYNYRGVQITSIKFNGTSSLSPVEEIGFKFCELTFNVGSQSFRFLPYKC